MYKDSKARQLKYLSVIVMLALVISSTGCRNSDNRRSETTISRYDDVEKVREMIKSTKMTSLKQVVGDTIEITGKTVFLIYTGYDCGICIEKGFDIVKRILDELENAKVHIIASNTNILNDQHRYDYKQYIFRDSKDRVRKQLKFYYSPAILFMKDNLEPAEVFFPGLDKKEQLNFEPLF